MASSCVQPRLPTWSRNTDRQTVFLVFFWWFNSQSSLRSDGMIDDYFILFVRLGLQPSSLEKTRKKTRAVLAFIAIQVGCFLVIGLLGFWKIQGRHKSVLLRWHAKSSACQLLDTQVSNCCFHTHPGSDRSPNVRGWLDWGVPSSPPKCRSYYIGFMVVPFSGNGEPGSRMG